MINITGQIRVKKSILLKKPKAAWIGSSPATVFTLCAKQNMAYRKALFNDGLKRNSAGFWSNFMVRQLWKTAFVVLKARWFWEKNSRRKRRTNHMGNIELVRANSPFLQVQGNQS